MLRWRRLSVREILKTKLVKEKRNEGWILIIKRWKAIYLEIYDMTWYNDMV